MNETPKAHKALIFCSIYKTRKEIQKYLELLDREHFRKKILVPLINYSLLKMYLTDKPKSPNQKYIITEKGQLLLSLIEKNEILS